LPESLPAKTPMQLASARALLAVEQLAGVLSELRHGVGAVKAPE